MNYRVQTTRKIIFSIFCLGFSLFSEQTAFSQKTWDGGAGTTAWSDAANWSADAIPTTTDSVIIAAGQTVTVSSGTAVCRKLNIIGSGTSQGKVTVNSGATLSVNADNVAVLNGSTNAALILLGGMLENNGVVTVTGKQSLDAIRFDNPTSGTLSSTYMGSGTLTCTTSSSSSGGGSGNTGASITFAQTSGTSTFTLNPTGIYNFATQVATTNGSKTAIYCPKGNAIINGTGTITVSGGRRSIRIIPTTGETANLTIETGVTMNLSSTITTTTLIGVVILDNSAANVSANMTNKGTMNLSGTGLNAIYMNNAAAATTTTNFTNEGTLNINGSFTEASSAGAIYMAGGINTFGDVLTNSGAINFNTTTDGTSTKPLFICSVSPLSTVHNSGTINVGANGTLTTAIRLGDNETTFNNTGTVNIEKGNITGFVSTGNAKFNNNTGGILNFKLAATDTVINNNVAFTNNGGTLKGSGIFGNTGSNTFTSGTIAPGQSPGKIILVDAALTFAGTYNAEIDGTAGAGVVGGNDQIEASTAAATVDINGWTIATTFSGSYTPANSDAIVLVNTNGGTINGTPIFSPALPANWQVSTTGGQLKITYDNTVPVELTSFNATPLSNKNLLTWETATEINSKGFEVQRKTIDGTWVSLGFVNSNGKAATYNFTDNTPLSISYYRLRQIDLDGVETLSKIVSVRQNTSGRISIVPNPTTEYVNIFLNKDDVSEGNITLNLYDITGKQVLLQNTSAETLQLDLSHLAKGVYLLTVQADNTIYQEKIIRQ